jgi:hypothetical protein
LKGKRVVKGEILVNFNSKVPLEVKKMYDALVSVKAGGAESVRQILEITLELFKERYPDEVKRAEAYMEIMNVNPPIKD